MCSACDTQAVASTTIDGETEYYLTLGEAITAVASCTADDEAGVKLYSNIDLGTGYQAITGGEFTLDLNGHKIEGAHTGSGTLRIRSGNVAITDSSDDGTGTITGYYGVRVDNGTVTINGVTISTTYSSQAVWVNGGTVTINGGTITGSTGVRVDNGTVTINGGSIGGKTADLRYETGTITLGLAEGATEGATFPDGLSVVAVTGSTITLNEILADGMAYWQDGMMLTVADDATEITDGTVTVKAVCLHSGNTNTVTDNENGTHSFTCAVCQNGVTENHTLSYSESGNTINASCKNNCGYTGSAAISAASKTYDGTAVTATVTGTGFLENETFTITYAVKGGAALDSTPVNAGTYTASITLGDATASVEFTIAKTDSTVAAPTANELTYTGEAQALVTAGTATGGKLVYSLTKDGEYSETIPTGKDATSYTVWYYVQGDANHADSEKKSLAVNIDKAQAEITVNTTPINVTYGETVTLPTATTNFGTVTCDKTAADLVNAGTYTVTYTVAGTDNYEGDTKSITVTVKAKAITAADVTLNGSLTYTGSEQTQPITVTEGITYTVTGDKATDVGTYELTVTASGNYTGKVKLSWSIKAAAATIETVPAASELTYTGEAQALVTAGTATGGKLVYSLTKDGEYSETIPTGKNATSYTVWYYVQGDANHADSEKKSLAVNIDKAQAAINVDTTPITVTYGETVTLPTATTNFGTVTCNMTAAELVNAGTYTVTYTVAGTDNYEGDSKTVTVNIGQKEVAEPTVTGTYTYTGSEQTVELAGVERYMTIASGNKGTNAGSYEVVVTLDGNHKWADGSDGKIQWSIGKATVTITADNKVIYIGEELPSLTCTVSGLMDGDELTKVPTLTTNADEKVAGSYTITAANANAGDNYEISYVSGILTIMDKETEVETKIVQTELTEVPDSLKDTQFDTVEEITEELISKILATATGYSEENTEHYDLTLQFSLDGGDTWILATEENFPTEGITLILPYPDGTNARDYEFMVSHMFTVTSQRLGTTAGDVELPKVEETANGIRVTLNGLSPVTVAARYHDHTGGTATCTDKAICSVCGSPYGELDATNHAGGTEVKNAKEATCGAEGYTGDTCCKGCGEVVTKGTAIKATGEHTYGEWKVVKEATKTAKGEKQCTCSVCGHVDSEEIPMLPDVPATGDDSYIMLWGSAMVISLAALAVLLVESKKRKSAQ